jgi:hypothetical protein
MLTMALSLDFVGNGLAHAVASPLPFRWLDWPPLPQLTGSLRRPAPQAVGLWATDHLVVWR